MRRSNVYEERSLGIYESEVPHHKDHQDLEANKSDPEKFDVLEPARKQKSKFYYIGQELQKQLGHDIWFPTGVCIAVICIETADFNKDPVTFSAFNIMFECVSAYANVGLSVGLPDQTYSLCGKFHIVSKFLLCFAMLRGRHRGLPVAIDRAIQMPSDVPGEMEEEDHQRRLRFSFFSYGRKRSDVSESPESFSATESQADKTDEAPQVELPDEIRRHSQPGEQILAEYLG